MQNDVHLYVLLSNVMPICDIIVIQKMTIPCEEVNTLVQKNASF